MVLRTVLGSAAFASMVHTTAFAQSEMVIDWSLCTQPDLASSAYQTAVTQLIDKYVKEASTKYKSNHLAMRLHKIYGDIVQDRRDLVRLNYIPLSKSRTEKQCALSAANYRKLIVVRDTSYYILCRSEVAVGTSAAERAGKDITTLAAAAVYDFVKSLKSVSADLRATKGEPTTPPGGFAWCKKGVADTVKDPIPTPADVQGFKTRMSISAEERAGIGDPTKQ